GRVLRRVRGRVQPDRPVAAPAAARARAGRARAPAGQPRGAACAGRFARVGPGRPRAAGPGTLRPDPRWRAALPVRRGERQRGAAPRAGGVRQERGGAMTPAARRPRQRREPPAQARLDLYREHAAEYEAGREPSFVDVAPALYLALDGAGAHGGEEFQEATAVLYNVAFAIKMRRKAAGQDHAVAGLEAVWPEGPDAPRWRLLIRVPEYVRGEDIEEARKRVGRSGAAAVRLE